MAHRSEDMGRNLARPGNPSGQLAPSFPTPAINNAHVTQALPQDNNELVPVPPTVAPQISSSSSYLFGGTVPQAQGQNPFQQGAGGAGGIHYSGVPRRWPLGQPYPYGSQTQQQEAPRYQGGPEPIGPSDRSIWGLLPPMPPAQNAGFKQQQAAGAVAPYGSNGGAQPVGSNRYVGPSWAPFPSGPAHLAGTGRLAPTEVVASKPTKSLEEFLREQGVPVPVFVDGLPVLDDTVDECDAMVAELLGDPAGEEPGRVESAELLVVGAGANRLPPAMGFRSGPSRDQLGVDMARVPLPSSGAGGVGGRSSHARAAAAAARQWRTKKMAEKRAAAAKARAQKLAAARGCPEGTQGPLKPSRT